MSGKKYTDSLKGYDRDAFYGPVEALKLVKSTAKAKFDENVDVVFRLGVDPRKAAGLEKAADNPGSETAGSITEAQVEEIANVKMPDLNATDIEAAKQQIRGTARSMGIAVS